MIDKKPGLRAILDINLRFVQAAAALFYGWLCWQWTSPEWWGFGLTAVLCFIGGSVALIATLFKVAALVLRERKLRTFARQGGKARADSMARESDLRDRGLIR